MGIVTEPSGIVKYALEVKDQIQAMALRAQRDFIEMGRLLKIARDAAHWSDLGFESFKEYVEDIGLPMQSSYSWATRLIGIYEMIVLKYPDVECVKIGVAKLTRLLPAARLGKLDQELLDKALVLSDLDLRRELGHNVPTTDGSEMIICTRCGAEIFGARWVSGIYADKSFLRRP